MRNEAEQFRLLVESVEDYAIFMLDPEGRIVSWNRGAERINGYTAAEVVGEHFRVLYPEEDRRRGHPEDELRVAAGRGRYEEEGWRVRKDGSLFPAHVTITAIRDRAGRLVGYAKVMRDITERRRTEEIRESERRVRELAENLLEVFWTASPGFARALYVSPAYEEIWGRSVESLYRDPKSFLAAVHPEDRAEVLAFMARLRQEAASVDHRIIRPDGEVRWVRMRGFPVRDPHGRIERIVGVSEDITTRKHAEQALRESEQNFRALANSIPQLAWMADPTGWIFWYNDRWYEYTGTTLEEMQGWGWRKVHDPEHVDRVVERIRHAFETGEPWEDTFPLRSRTGEYRWFLSRALPIKDAEGTVVRWFGTNTDVTEQLEATAEREQLLGREREARERVTTILESITDAFYALDQEWRFTYVNRQAEPLLQKSREELLGKRLWDEFPESVGTKADHEFHRAAAEQVTVEFEQLYAPLDLWAEVRAYPSPEGLSVYFRDVTERKRAEEALRENEERFRALAENATMAIFVVDEASTIEFANPAVERIFGYAIPEMLGRSLDMLMPEDQRPLHHAGMRRYLATGRRNIPWEGVELPGLTKDGRIIPLEISFGEFARGGRHYFTGIARDITERKRADEAIRESEERYRLLADMIPQHIWTTAPDGYHNYFSRRWYEFTGATPEQTRGEGWLDLLHPADRERTIARWQRSLETGEPYAIEYRFRRADGKYCWFLGQAMPLRNEAGQIVRWFGTLTDISQRKRLDEERERLLSREREARAEAERRREELERVTESRARLMRGFSHDVKNPLGAADGYLQLMEEGLLGHLSEKPKETVGKVRRSIGAALNLIEDLLELARAEAGQIEIERAPTDLREVAREAVEEYRAQAEAEGLSLVVELPDELPVIESDARRIRQVVGNLLSNAVKYTERGGITMRVEVWDGGKAPGPGRWIAMAVSDSGPGIPEEQQRLVFQEFRRLETAGEETGAGIGLAISRRIAHALDGDITVESEVGKGSTFTLWLPTGAAGGRPVSGMTEAADQISHAAGIRGSGR